MKLVSAVLALLLGFSNFAYSKSIEISGVRAFALIELGGAFGASDAGMGQSYLKASAKCSKIAHGKDSEIKCSMNQVEKSTKNHGDYKVVIELRRLLIEATQAEKKTSPMERRIEIPRIDCHATNYGLEVGAIDTESMSSCTIDIQP